MSELVEGVVTATFEHHLVIALPDGRAIQVPSDAIGPWTEVIEGVPLLAADTRIERVFAKQQPKPQQRVLIRKTTLGWIPEE